MFYFLRVFCAGYSPQKRTLKTGAVPSQFSWTCPEAPSVQSRRQRAQRRLTRSQLEATQTLDTSNPVVYDSELPMESEEIVVSTTAEVDKSCDDLSDTVHDR